MFDKNGDLSIVDGDEELVQSVSLTLQTRKGEFFLESEHGLVLDNLLGKVANATEAKEDIVEAISQETRIAAIESVIIADDRKQRTRSISLRLKKENGETLSVSEVSINA